MCGSFADRDVDESAELFEALRLSQVHAEGIVEVDGISTLPNVVRATENPPPLLSRPF